MTAPFDPRPVALEGNLVRLEPLTLDHLPELAAIAFEPTIWRWLRVRVETPGDLRRFVEDALAQQAAGSQIPWVTRSLKDGRVAGSTRLTEINRSDRGVEIGWTWLHPDFRRSGINVEAKFLQLRHAFEDLGAIRVALKTHVNNVTSQNAILALGATPEGTFRNHMIYPDGSLRHSMWFSILPEEWPAVKARLEERLARQK